MMAKQSKIAKKSVALDKPAPGSRIRRDPPPPVATQKALDALPGEREAWTVVIGVLLFAVAFAIIIVGVSDYTAS